jgi:hypothetical protein
VLFLFSLICVNTCIYVNEQADVFRYVFVHIYCMMVVINTYIHNDDEDSR